MKTILLGFLFTSALLSQGIRYDPQPTTTIGSNGSPGGYPPVLAIPGATITVCNYNLTTHSCGASAVTYTDGTLTTPCPSSNPVVYQGSTACMSMSDKQGNLGFWVTPGGSYAWSMTISNGQSYGPFPFTAPFTYLTPYNPSGYTPMAGAVDNSVFPAPLTTTQGTPAAPITNGQPGMFCQIVGSTAATPGDQSTQPACFKAYAIATQNGSTSNVMAIEGIAQTDGGCGGGEPTPPCTSNAVGGIGGMFMSNSNTGAAPSFGLWALCQDHGFLGGCAGEEIDSLTQAAGRTEGLIRGLQVVNVDYSSGVNTMQHDWGIYSLGYGHGFLFGSNGNPGNTFIGYEVQSGSTPGNAGTTVMKVDAGPQYGTGIDFSAATFNPANGALKQPSIGAGITNASGYEHFTACASNCDVTVTMCVTGASVGATCSNTVPLPVNMSSVNYTAVCQGVSTVGGTLGKQDVIGKNTNSLVVAYTSFATATFNYPELDCEVIHP